MNSLTCLRFGRRRGVDGIYLFGHNLFYIDIGVQARVKEIQ